MRIGINPPRQPAGDLLELKIVERKGLGHPDTICDEIAEEFSLALSRYYLAEFLRRLRPNDQAAPASTLLIDPSQRVFARP
jgi:S-adenosylmethionine synthetase